MNPHHSESLLQTCDRLQKMGLWHNAVFDFLRRPVALGLMNDCMLQSSKSTDETILVLVSALQYVDLRYREQNVHNSFFDNPFLTASFERLLVDHHDEVYHLCVNNRVQANIPARALPVLDLIYRYFDHEPVQVIELGASAGLLGMVMINTKAVQQNPLDYFLAGQKFPSNWPNVIKYQGFDLIIAKSDWVVACIHQAELRRLCQKCLAELNTGTNFSLDIGSALNFPHLPSISKTTSTKTVILTSYLLYQLPLQQKEQLIQSITNFLVKDYSIWINLDLYTDSLCKNRFIAQVNGSTVLELSDDYCHSWQEV